MGSERREMGSGRREMGNIEGSRSFADLCYRGM